MQVKLLEIQFETVVWNHWHNSGLDMYKLTQNLQSTGGILPRAGDMQIAAIFLDSNLEIQIKNFKNAHTP